MYSLIKSHTMRALLVEQLPVFLVSFLIATLFYHFGNFAPEALAFLATWYVLDWGYQMVRRALFDDKKYPVA